MLADAFPVRMLRVPALMSVFGEHIWWLPRWLDRRLKQTSRLTSASRGWSEESGLQESERLVHLPL